MCSPGDPAASKLLPMHRALLVGLLLTVSVAQAEVKLPGTQVSYKLRTDSFSGENASMLFVDALEDPSGKTYVAFVCDLGTPFARFYSRAALGRVGDAPRAYVRADQGRVRPLSGRVRDDLQTGKASVLDTTSASTAALLRAFTSARTVTVRIERLNMAALTLTFPTGGFAEGWRAIRNCD